MGLDLYFNILWLVPLAAWLATRNTSPIVRAAITGALFGLVVSYALKGLYALYFIWPVSDWLGQGVFYLRFIHDVAATRVAIVLQLISADSPVTADQRLLLEVVKTVLGGITYGFLGFLLGYFRHKYQQNNHSSP